MTDTWYAKPDDLIGGWCVMDIDLTPGELSEQPEVVRAQHMYIASFTRQEHAEEIAGLHNAAKVPAMTADWIILDWLENHQNLNSRTLSQATDLVVRLRDAGVVR